MKLESLRFQNPHWDGVENFLRDPSLGRLKTAPKILFHPIKNRIILESNCIFIMKGPRQVGKTTLLKLMMKEILQSGKPPGSLLYLAVDIAGLKSKHDLSVALVTYNEFHGPNGPGTRFIFLDEVTAAADWQTAIKNKKMIQVKM